ncbi:MAG: ankyrin repeat domain-containing protein [Burkholderiales bacterium]|nr:ankyrin repeat domain-containing protein [Burkholderiales bacterium]
MLLRSVRVVFVALLLGAGTATAQPTLDDLFRAVDTNNVLEVRSLIDRGMDANSTNAQGRTLLMQAAWDGHIEIVQLLLDKRARLNVRNPSGETAIMLAAMRGNLAVVELLYNKGAEINHSGWTPLHYCAWESKTEVCRFLVAKKADVNARAPNDSTPLMVASRQGAQEVVRLLLANGANPNLESDRGMTAMELALKAGNTDIADMLKKAGASR